MSDLEDVRAFLHGRKEVTDEDDLAGSFPTREEFEKFCDTNCAPQIWELFMVRLLDEGIVGMDGFKYCWPEVAKENRKKMLEAIRWRNTA